MPENIERYAQSADGSGSRPVALRMFIPGIRFAPEYYIVWELDPAPLFKIGWSSEKDGRGQGRKPTFKFSAAWKSEADVHARDHCCQCLAQAFEMHGYRWVKAICSLDWFEHRGLRSLSRGAGIGMWPDCTILAWME